MSAAVAVVLGSVWCYQCLWGQLPLDPRVDLLLTTLTFIRSPLSPSCDFEQLANTEEFQHGKSNGSIGECFVRCNNIQYIRELPEEEQGQRPAAAAAAAVAGAGGQQDGEMAAAAA